MSKRLLIGLSVIALLFAGGLWLAWPQARIGHRNFQKIQEGMTQSQVEAIIGMPPGDYFTGFRGGGGMMSRGPFGFTREEKGLPEKKIPEAWYRNGLVKSWWGNSHAIHVAFDKTGGAIAWQFQDVVGVRAPTIFERFKSLLGWYD